MKAASVLLLSLGILCTLWIPSVKAEESAAIHGRVKLGVAAVSEDGAAASVVESYNISKGLTLSRLFLTGKLGTDNTVSIDVGNVTRHQRDARLEFTRSRLLNLRLYNTRMRYLQSGPATPEFARERTRFSGNFTPTKWLKLYGGLSSQQKEGDRAALLSEGADFPGTSYDYSITTRNVGGQLRANGRSVELNYEWRRFESGGNSLLDREGRRLRISTHVPIASMLRFSGSYLGDRSILAETDDALNVKSYSGTLTFLPAKRVSFSGYVSHKNAENDLTETTTRRLRAGGKATVRPLSSFRGECGYEYTRISEAGGREVSGNALLLGATLWSFERAKLTLRYRVRNTDRSDYTGLTGPFDTENFLVRIESSPSPSVRFSIGFEDKDRSNDELMSWSRTRGVTGFADLTCPTTEYRASLRLSGSAFKSEFREQERGFVTDNVLLSARMRFVPLSRLSVECGITHIQIKEDLDIRKDVAVASVEYEFIPGYAVELRYDLFSYDDFASYDRNYAANVLTLNFSKTFGYNGRKD